MLEQGTNRVPQSSLNPLAATIIADVRAPADTRKRAKCFNMISVFLLVIKIDCVSCLLACPLRPQAECSSMMPTFIWVGRFRSSPTLLRMEV